MDVNPGMSSNKLSTGLGECQDFVNASLDGLWIALYVIVHKNHGLASAIEELGIFEHFSIGVEESEADPGLCEPAGVRLGKSYPLASEV